MSDESASDTEGTQSAQKSCLGCGGHSKAEFVWHDGLYRSYVCADHAKDQLPKRGRDEYREMKLKNGGRDRIVSGYATPMDKPQKKVIWEEEVQAHAE